MNLAKPAPKDLEQIAIIADIHGNLTALQAVLNDIKKLKHIILLGDVVGYGASPGECIDLLLDLKSEGQKIDFQDVVGNHDQATIDSNFEGFKPVAKAMVMWTQDQLLHSPKEKRDKRYAFLSRLKERISAVQNHPNHLFVHGSPRDPLREYILPPEEDPRMARRLQENLGVMRQQEVVCAFVSHSHIPGVWEAGKGRYKPPFSEPTSNEEDPSKPQFSEKDLFSKFGIHYLDELSYPIINVGSVGQPRDGNPKARYVILGGDYEGTTIRRFVTFKQVEYGISQETKRLESSNINAWLARHPEIRTEIETFAAPNRAKHKVFQQLYGGDIANYLAFRLACAR